MRLWYQSMTPLTRLERYAAALAQHAKEVCSPGVEVEVHGVAEAPYAGLMPADLLKYPFAKFVLQAECIELARQAERDGFDAFILGSFSEPFLPEIRSALDIPVVSMAEATLLVACSLAEQFALVTLAPANVKRLRGVVRRHEMERRVCGVHSLAHKVDEADLDAALAGGAAVVEDFTRVAMSAIEAGADVVVPAEGVLNEVVRRSGLRTLAGATVLDCVGASLLYAELMVHMQQRLGAGVGRRWGYAKPAAELLARLRLVADFGPPR
jgi:Asp/Glu/hydantoin racemase